MEPRYCGTIRALLERSSRLLSVPRGTVDTSPSRDQRRWRARARRDGTAGRAAGTGRARPPGFRKPAGRQQAWLDPHGANGDEVDGLVQLRPGQQLLEPRRFNFRVLESQARGRPRAEMTAFRVFDSTIRKSSGDAQASAGSPASRRQSQVQQRWRSPALPAATSGSIRSRSIAVSSPPARGESGEVDLGVPLGEQDDSSARAVSSTSVWQRCSVGVPRPAAEPIPRDSRVLIVAKPLTRTRQDRHCGGGHAGNPQRLSKGFRPDLLEALHDLAERPGTRSKGKPAGIARALHDAGRVRPPATAVGGSPRYLTAVSTDARSSTRSSSNPPAHLPDR